MCMPAACTSQPQDTDLPIDGLSLYEVNYGVHVRAMGGAVSFGCAPWACFVFP